MYSLGSEISYEDDKYWISDTVCHCGNKHKLYFYKESKNFYCYTNCGSMDIIEVVKNHFEYEDDEFYKCIDYICKITKINVEKIGFGTQSRQTVISDFDFIRRYKKINSNKNIENKSTIDNIRVYDEDVFKIFQPLYYKGWIEEGISISSMIKYEIAYSVVNQQIIIPHRNIANQLIGIRVRNLRLEDVEVYGKYTPYKRGSEYYNHPLGNNLYGLNVNLDGIKRKQKIMLVEAEKSVLQADTMFRENNFTLALCGSNLTDTQREILISLVCENNIREVVFALDKQYKNTDSKEYEEWIKKIKKLIGNLPTYVTTSVMLDNESILNYKDSPTDRGYDTFMKLYEGRFPVVTKN